METAMETKISHGSATKILDAKAGIIEAYVNTMEDIISKAAFDNSLGSLPIPVLASHDQSEVVGKVLTARAVAGADGSRIHRLHATMQMNMETQAGREAFSNVAGDFVREWSVGFNMRPNGSKIETIDGMSVRVIEDLDWVEASTVIRGASPYTQTISAKAAEKDAIPGHDTSTSGAPSAMGGADIPEDADLEPAELDKAQSAPGTAQDAAPGTDNVVKHDYGVARLKLTQLKLKLAQAKKEFKS
jgi:phage head maturation protease